MSETRRQQSLWKDYVHLLRCPVSQTNITGCGTCFLAEDGTHTYSLSETGIPQFASEFISEDAAIQREHYDRIAMAYVENLGYPHTQEYMRYLDSAMMNVIPSGSLGTVAEICCGRGEAFEMIGSQVEAGIGVDISPAMLEEAAQLHAANTRLRFVQGDATNLPLQDASFDNVFMFGGIHHVNDRQALFSEIARILKPGGTFYYREPVSDFFLWKLLRAIIYRLSPNLDHDTERPLLYRETVPFLERASLSNTHWTTHGFLGFCLLMNSDVLIFNRLFRFIPGIKTITRLFARLDKMTLQLPGMTLAGLQVVGVARKRAS